MSVSLSISHQRAPPPCRDCLSTHCLCLCFCCCCCCCRQAVLVVGFLPEEYEALRAMMLDIEADMVKVGRRAAAGILWDYELDCQYHTSDMQCCCSVAEDA
jgi:hypothetical protein